MDTSDERSQSAAEDAKSTLHPIMSPKVDVDNAIVELKPTTSKESINPETLISSGEVELVTNVRSLIIIDSDTNSKCENTDSIITLSDTSTEPENLRKLSLDIKRKASDDLKTSKIRLVDSIASSSTDNSFKNVTNIFNCVITPVKTQVKRRNSFSGKSENVSTQNLNKKLKRSLSTEINTDDCATQRTRSLRRNSDDNVYDIQNNMSKIAFEKNINSQNPYFSTIEEESLTKPIEESQNNNSFNDSQNIVLNYSPEDTESRDTQLLGTLGVQHFSSNQETVLLKKESSSISDDHIDQDTTTSLNLDSPGTNDVPLNIPLHNKPLYSAIISSTPENNLLSQKKRFKSLKNVHVSDDSDNTPEFNKTPKVSVASKMDSIGDNISISPLSNGHSNGSHVNSLSNLRTPCFDINVQCDDHSDFLSLTIVKIDSELGIDMSKEYQKVSKKMCKDYSADNSKTSSQSSVTSGGLFQLPLHPRTSYSSFSSNTSSTRTCDDAFVVPLRPQMKNFSTVKGVQALKQKLDEITSRLFEHYGMDSTFQSNSNSANNSAEFKKHNISNGKIHNEQIESVQSTTPKSSKKKIQCKSKRPPNRKLKRDILPITKEETQSESEALPSDVIINDPNRCPRPSTPLTSIKDDNMFLNNNNNLIKQTSPTSTSPKLSHSPTPKYENGCYSEKTLVLAKWRDKKYYSGKVKETLDANKYIIEFDDGAIKMLMDNFIIFGNTKELPIVGQSVHVVVDDDRSYEPGLVLNLNYDKDGIALYKCTTDSDTTVSVKASDIYLTEDQAMSIRENLPKSPHSAPNTPRRRINRDLDLDNIINGPRVPRLREKSKKDITSSPSASKASTSGISRKQYGHRDSSIPFPKQRQESESSEGGEITSRAPSTSLEEVSGVQPEIQKTPRKIDGITAGALLIKGISKQNAGKRCSKITKFESDFDTNNHLGPIPPKGSLLFQDLHFLLTCTDLPNPRPFQNKCNNSTSPSHWSSNDSSSTEKEDRSFATAPFQKERLKEQLESAGGKVYSHFEEVPKNIYKSCKLIAPRPCLTAKYIQCLAADIPAISHFWVIRSCIAKKLTNTDEDALPAGWSIERQRFINWQVSTHNRTSSTPFKNCLILLCSDNESFIKFWKRVCLLAGGETRTINEEDLNLSGGLVIVTESDCPHEVQNKAIQDKIPLVSTIWVTQCLIEGKICDHNKSVKYSFTYNDVE